MTPWLALALYAVGVGVAAPSLLRALGTRNVGARLEIAAWLTALASMLAAALWMPATRQRRKTNTARPTKSSQAIFGSTA